MHFLLLPNGSQTCQPSMRTLSSLWLSLSNSWCFEPRAIFVGTWVWMSDPMRLLSKIPVSDYNCRHFEGLKPPTVSSTQTQYINNVPVAGESMQPGDWWGTLGFHTHANYVHLCWKATALARRPSDSIRVFFKLTILTASFYWCSEGFPCRFHCVCTQLLCNMDSF